MKPNSPWLRWGLALWLFLALNGLVFFLINQWITLQLLRDPSERLVQGLAAVGLPHEIYGGFLVLSNVLTFLVFFVVSALIVLRRPQDGFALFTAIFFVGFGASSAYPTVPEFMAFYENPPGWYQIPYLISTLTSWPLLLAFLVLYPDGRFVPRWSWIPAVLGVLFTTLWTFFPAAFGGGDLLLRVVAGVLAVAVVAMCLVAQYWRYRHYSSPVQRQQTKWFLYALLIFFAGLIVSFLGPPASRGGLMPSDSLTADLLTVISNNLVYIVLPIAVGIAILRYRLWDIDILIRKTLTFAILAALLAAVYFGSVILLQQVFATVSGQRSEVVTVLSTLLIAALFVPLRGRIQGFIDRRFYRNKYDAQKVLTEFSATVRDETDLPRLTGKLVEVVQETMQPNGISVWLKRDQDAGSISH